MTLPFTSKLPNQQASIFSTMTELANQHQALNLSQGFPDYPVDTALIELINKYLQQGCNQYAPMAGVPLLRERIAAKYRLLYDLDIDANQEITITSGATQALFAVISATVRAGDEVIVFEPAYDSYAAAITLSGGTVVPIRLNAPDYRIDWQEVASKVNNTTRLIIINHPNNPTGRLFNDDDVEQLARIIHSSNALLLSDEVYEHMVFDGAPVRTVLQHPLLRQRAFVTASFGKLLHATGWKVGYCVAAPELTAELRKVHQYNVFSVHTPTQWAIAEYLERPENYLGLPQFFQQKRDYLLSALASSRFKLLPTEGTYFLTLDYSAISDLPERAFATELITRHHIATVPISAFYSDERNQSLVRLCFAKTQATLEQAVARLNRV